MMFIMKGRCIRSNANKSRKSELRGGVSRVIRYQNDHCVPKLLSLVFFAH